MPNFNGLWTSRQQMQARGGNVWPSVPGAPTSPVATAGNMSASVAFVAPADTGYPAGAITGYRVTSTPGGFTGTGLTSPVTVTGLTNGTAYTFTVAAQNVNGYGPESVASNSVTPVLPNYVEDVFSTYLYTGNGATQTINNSINLSSQGGLVWTKTRNVANSNWFIDTVRGGTQLLRSNTTEAQFTDPTTRITSFGSSSYTVDSGDLNTSTQTEVSWAFKEQAKFFDIVTYTGNGASSRAISHNLGSTPGCVIIKKTSGTANWLVWHRSLGFSSPIRLNLTTAASSSSDYWSAASSTTFTIGFDTDVNDSGFTYVMYLFAHDAGGFGATGSDNVISCGSFTASGGNTNVTLGYEPQWVMIKPSSIVGNWRMFDTMRGFSGGLESPSGETLYADLSNAAAASCPISPTATGFGTTASGLSTGDYIYIAIRKGPMAVPTLGTTVFNPLNRTGTGSATYVATSGFTTDTLFVKKIEGTGSSAPGFFWERIGPTNKAMTPTSSAAENTLYQVLGFDAQNNDGVRVGNTNNYWDASGGLYNVYSFRRAPSFHDVVLYTGTGVARTVAHNLGVVPEMMIVKSRTTATTYAWSVYVSTLGNASGLDLSQTYASAGLSYWNSTTPTSSVFSLNASFSVNQSATPYLAYLFATCPGVSKVGSYTGTGATQTIACGFAAGARWVMIKRTDSTGDWYVWNSSSGMVAGTNPYTLFNTNAASVNTNSVYTITTGFQIVSTAAGINASGGTYIFLAIA